MVTLSPKVPVCTYIPIFESGRLSPAEKSVGVAEEGGWHWNRLVESSTKWKPTTMHLLVMNTSVDVGTLDVVELSKSVHRGCDIHRQIHDI